MTTEQAASGPKGIERRRARRRTVMESFSFFVTVPKKGPHQLEIHDISDLGIRFELDTVGEDTQTFPVALGDALSIRLYFNRTLFLPLEVKIARMDVGKDGRRQIGAETLTNPLPVQQALQGILNIVDQLAEIGQVDSGVSP